MGLHCVVGVTSRVNDMAPRRVGMVCRLFMVSRLMVLGSFRVVMRGMFKML